MKISADKQLQKITIEQIKTILKDQVPDKFDKMIISENQEFKRADYSFSKMKFQKVEREIGFVKFPLYDAVTDNFKEIEGGEKLFGQKAVLKNWYKKIKNEIGTFFLRTSRTLRPSVAFASNI